MIDFNDEKYIIQKPLVTKKALLKYISEEDILYTYLPDIPFNHTICSPLREDNNPSFNIFYSDITGCIMYNDFAFSNKSGDLIFLIKELFSLTNYQHALEKIANDFGLNEYFNFIYDKVEIITPKYANKKRYENKKYDLKIKIREWKEEDISFWKSFGISLSTLNKFNVFPISSYFNNDFEVPTREYSYAFVEIKDNKITYKIYRPFERKTKKWRTNHNNSIHQGYSQLPEKGNIFIITKSLKDVMSLYEVTNIPSIGIQAENYFIKESVFKEYRIRFNHVFSLFDNDSTGKDLAFKYQKEFNISPLFIPNDFFPIKDFSDLVRYTNKETAINVINNLIK